MLTKRIIPCLDVKDGRVVKGVRFLNLRDAGDPVELAALYQAEGADELVFLDITASPDRRKTVVDMVSKVAEQVSIPFAVGGGIRTTEDMRLVLESGADKVHQYRRCGDPRPHHGGSHSLRQSVYCGRYRWQAGGAGTLGSAHLRRS